MQKGHTYTVDGLINGGGGAYIWLGLYPEYICWQMDGFIFGGGGGLKPGGFKVGFYNMLTKFSVCVISLLHVC